MGVKGLWLHLAPAGRRVSLEDFEGKVLAIDVSIWAIQFMYTTQNSNEYGVLDGFLRRICKLLFYGIRPVFVFDGKTPQLKQKTLMNRKMQRRTQQINFHHVAEKLVHNVAKEALLSKQIKEKEAQGSSLVDADDQESNNSRQISPIRESLRNVVHSEEESSSSLSQAHIVEGLLYNSVRRLKYQLPNLRQNIIDSGMDPAVFEDLPLQDQQAYLKGFLAQFNQSLQQKQRSTLKKDDLESFSNLQISNFIRGVQEKKDFEEQELQRQMMQQAEQGKGGTVEHQDIATIKIRTDAELAKQYLPDNILDVGGHRKVRRRKGRNDLQKLREEREKMRVGEISAGEEGQDGAAERAEMLREMRMVQDPVRFLKEKYAARVEDEVQEEATEGLEASLKDKKEENHVKAVKVEELATSLLETELEKKQETPCEEDSSKSEEEEEEDLFGSNIVPEESQKKVIVNDLGVGAINKYALEQPRESEASESDSLFGNQADGKSSNEEENKALNENACIMKQSIEKEDEPTKAKDEQRSNSEKGSKEAEGEPQINQEQRDLKKSKKRTYRELCAQGSLDPPENLRQAQKAPAESEEGQDEQEGIDAIEEEERDECDKEDEAQVPRSDSKVDDRDPKSQAAAHFDDFDGKEQKDDKKTVVDFEQLKQDIYSENMKLIQQLEKGSKSFSVFSQDLIDDLKRLLQLMGIPYVQAPYEAESQCAFLELNGLVDGVVTEDSDALLFGSCNVLRNIFDNNKFVEQYEAHRIQREMGLSRPDLIKMALFMGSDYTQGVRGIAAVNSIEIINCFPDVELHVSEESKEVRVEEARFGSGLRRFKDWVDLKYKESAAHNKQKPKTAKERQLELIEELLESSSEQSDEENDHLQANKNIEKAKGEQQLEEQIEQMFHKNQDGRAHVEREKRYKQSHTNLRKHWVFPTDFPSKEIFDSYLKPTVDESKEAFSWGEPAFAQLEAFARRQLGWRDPETSQYIHQVQKRIDERKERAKARGLQQNKIERYFQRSEENRQPMSIKFAQIKSVRTRKAVKDLRKKQREQNKFVQAAKKRKVEANME